MGAPMWMAVKQDSRDCRRRSKPVGEDDPQRGARAGAEHKRHGGKKNRSADGVSSSACSTDFDRNEGNAPDEGDEGGGACRARAWRQQPRQAKRGGGGRDGGLRNAWGPMSRVRIDEAVDRGIGVDKQFRQNARARSALPAIEAEQVRGRFVSIEDHRPSRRQHALSEAENQTSGRRRRDGRSGFLVRFFCSIICTDKIDSS